MNFANRVTLVRIFLIPFFVIAVVYYNSQRPELKWVAFVLFMTACLTDALDGLIARITNEKTTLGSFLDPFADKLLLLTAFLSVNFLPNYPVKLSPWVLILIVSRELILVSGLIILFFSRNEIKVEPNLLGKFTTVIQMVTAGALLCEFQWAIQAAYLAAFLTICSALSYVLREAGRLNHAGNKT